MESNRSIQQSPSDEGDSASGNQSRSRALLDQQVSVSLLSGDSRQGRALIDTDFYLYKAAAASTFTFKWDDNNRVGMTNIAMARDKFQTFIDWVEDTLETLTPVLCLGGSSNFRYGLYPNYKANRREKVKPWGYGELVQWAMESFLCVQIEDVETDDVIGMHYRTGDVIISGDKDLKTIPGLHLEGEGLIDISEDEADHRFYMQALTGDATDGYPGCKGVGPVKAEALLKDCETNEDRWEAVANQYLKAGHDITYALTQARLARILRRGEYDDEPKLWMPPIKVVS